MIHKTPYTVLIVAIFFLAAFSASAYVASSTNYRLESDSINMGGELSSSTNYILEDTAGEVGSGTSSSATFRVNAGYQQMRETYIAVTAPGNVTLSPAIPTSGGGVANGQASWIIATDNHAGYSVSFSASGSPALLSGVNNFANYTPASSDPDFSFTVGASSAEFGFSPEGVDILSRFLDNGSSCSAGTNDTSDRCWDQISTTPQQIASRTTGTGPSGNTLTVKFRAESGASNIQPSGTYQATSTLTVMAR